MDQEGTDDPAPTHTAHCVLHLEAGLALCPHAGVLVCLQCIVEKSSPLQIIPRAGTRARQTLTVTAPWCRCPWSTTSPASLPSPPVCLCCLELCVRRGAVVPRGGVTPPLLCPAPSCEARRMVRPPSAFYLLSLRAWPLRCPSGLITPGPPDFSARAVSPSKCEHPKCAAHT